jgi:hypothetical protein
MRLRKAFLVSSLAAGTCLFSACAAHEQGARASPAADAVAPAPCRGGVLIPGHAGPRGYWIGEHWDCPAVKGPGHIAVFTDSVPPG